LICLSVTQEPWLRQLLELQIPSVLADFPIQRPIGSAPDVLYADPMFGYYGAVEHFVSRGLKRIYYVGSYISNPTPSPLMSSDEAHAYRSGKIEIDPDSFLRLSAYRQAMDEFGLPVEDNWICYDWHDAESMLKLADRFAALPEDKRPQAAVCHSIAQAQFLIGALAERDVPFAAAGTTPSPMNGAALNILLDGRWLGETAAALMVSRLQQPNRPQLRVGVPMQLQQSPVGELSMK